ncbi:MAG: asparagine synthase (glutamine-hydrolyzing) [Pirellulales bacterium]
MCGITGAVWSDPRLAITPEVLAQMTRALAHRGPDSDGFYSSALQVASSVGDVPGIAFGHRRLAIIDRDASLQPMANEDGSVQVVFNGEIYNFRELRHRLEASGHRFRSQGDTEVLVHLYEDEGVDFVRHLVGMFAIAIWDAGRRRLVLARDRIGQKPLVYRHEPGRLMFASELKGLLAAPDVPREVDPVALDEYLTYQYVPAPRTILRGIAKLPPGCIAVYEHDSLRVEPYWQGDFSLEVTLSQAEYVDRLRATLSEAVRSQLVSDVPLGVFLSGGVDSSIIAALIRGQVSGLIQTFTVRFSDPTYDESEFARGVARHLGTEHHELSVEPQLAALISELSESFDEPFGDSSALPTYCLARATREHVTVALSGDGGDELFGGYNRYRAIQLAARLPAPLRALVTNRRWQRLPVTGRQKHVFDRAVRFARIAALPPERRYLELMSIFNERDRAGLYSESFVQQLDDHDPATYLFAALARSGERDAVTAASLADLVTYLPGDLCQKIDMATMAHGLECRQPMLDHRLVELAAAMPANLKLRGGRGKWILERAFGHLLPTSVFRRAKMGFGVPVDEWFRGELKELLVDTLLSVRATGRGYFHTGEVERLIAEHDALRRDHSHRLWLLLMLELWHRRWLDSPGDRSGCETLPPLTPAAT